MIFLQGMLGVHLLGLLRGLLVILILIGGLVLLSMGDWLGLLVGIVIGLSEGCSVWTFLVRFRRLALCFRRARVGLILRKG